MAPIKWNREKTSFNQPEDFNKDESMIAKILITITQKILRISQKENIPIMFMGGIAVSL